MPLLNANKQEPYTKYQGFQVILKQQQNPDLIYLIKYKQLASIFLNDVLWDRT